MNELFAVIIYHPCLSLHYILLIHQPVYSSEVIEAKASTEERKWSSEVIVAVVSRNKNPKWKNMLLGTIEFRCVS